MKGRLGYGALVVAVCAFTASALAVNIETVTVGNPGNAGELSGAGASPHGRGPDRICGSVGYVYQIGKFEITAAQYVSFLNSVATTDQYGLYHTGMATDEYGCQISRAGSPGSYTYSVAADFANRPVNYVSWGDAARFCNWLHNGQPTGPQSLATTEDGSYYLNGATNAGPLGLVTRKADATWVMPTEDEWYKAAYHKNDGVTGNYWDYPTSSNSVPSNALVNPDPGNNANYAYTLLGPYYRTVVGEFENSESPYGTFDQAGNVWEMNESLIVLSGFTYRGMRGMCCTNYDTDCMHAAYRTGTGMTLQGAAEGFRVALVPEPASLALLAVVGLLAVRRR